MIVPPPQGMPVMPADYYRRYAARARQLAADATTPAVKEALRNIAAGYDKLAERVEAAVSPSGEAPSGDAT